jgi:PAS domain-containing protein
MSATQSRTVESNGGTTSFSNANEESLRLLVGSANNLAFFTLDAAGRVTVWNPAAEQLFACQRPEPLRQHLYRLFASDPQHGAQERQLSLIYLDRPNRKTQAHFPVNFRRP